MDVKTFKRHRRTLMNLDAGEIAEKLSQEQVGLPSVRQVHTDNAREFGRGRGRPLVRDEYMPPGDVRKGTTVTWSDKKRQFRYI